MYLVTGNIKIQMLKSVTLLLALMLAFACAYSQRVALRPAVDREFKNDFSKTKEKDYNWEKNDKGNKATIKNDGLQVSVADEMFLRPNFLQLGLEFYYYDWELSMDIDFKEAKEEVQAGFHMLSSGMSGYSLCAYITSKGNYRMYLLAESGAVLENFGPTLDTRINIGQINRLLFRKVGVMYQLLVNGNVLLNTELDNKYSRIGLYSLYFNRKQKTVIDNFAVKLIKAVSSPGLSLVASDVPNKRDYKNVPNGFSFLYDIGDTNHFVIRENIDKSKLEIKLLDGLPDVNLTVHAYQASLDSLIERSKKIIVFNYCYGCKINSGKPQKTMLDNGIELTEVSHIVDFGKAGKIGFVDLFLSNPDSKQKTILMQTCFKMDSREKDMMSFIMKDNIALSLKMK